MAAQLLFTVRDLTSLRLEQVELQRSDGSQLCVLGADQAEDYLPDRDIGAPAGEYFVDAKGRLVRIQVTVAPPRARPIRSRWRDRSAPATSRWVGRGHA